MSESKKVYSSEQKFKIIKEQLTTDISVTDICKKYEISPTNFYKWQRQFFESAKEGFDRKKDGLTKAELRKIAELENDNSRMKDVIAEITAENIIFKKKSGL